VVDEFADLIMTGKSRSSIEFGWSSRAIGIHLIIIEPSVSKLQVKIKAFSEIAE
jgi:hypothetical protein